MSEDLTSRQEFWILQRGLRHPEVFSVELVGNFIPVFESPFGLLIVSVICTDYLADTCTNYDIAKARRRTDFCRPRKQIGAESLRMKDRRERHHPGHINMSGCIRQMHSSKFESIYGPIFSVGMKS